MLRARSQTAIRLFLPATTLPRSICRADGLQSPPKGQIIRDKVTAFRKDSDVKSILQKVIGVLKGKQPTIQVENAKEEKLKLVLLELIALTSGNLVTNADDGGIPKSDWIASLRVVDDSLKTRREMYGHSRGYLEFLERFINRGEVK
jgi:hypothetical protein